ncbi:break repair meiotic recombinase recruitment factor 1 [Cuculus canorus]|uniref:break repair meiotic recombinase recruitment factor 1 n=1 Tax=Cuculus canorus TaxID=55661 RepID=UPI0023AB1876|nr:break repair meiotic recombinase recruitment factor 1 [Cuculus canorus]
MGKRKSERMAGGDGERHNPKMKRSTWEDSEVSGDDGLDGPIPARSGDDDGKPAAAEVEDRKEMMGGSAGTRSGNGDGAPEQNQAGEHGSSPWAQEGREPGAGGGGKSPEAPVVVAASLPASPHRLGLATHEPEEEPVAATERDGSTEEPDANNQTPCRMDVGDGSAEGAAGREIPVDAPAVVLEPCQEDGEHRGDPGEIRESASVVDAEKKEPSAASEPSAGAEQQESGSGERRQATGVNGAVENAAESRHSPGSSGFVEDLGMCAPAADLEGGVGAAGGNASLQEMARDGDTGWEEAGDIPSPASCAVPDPAVPNPAGLSPTVPDPAGEGEGQGLTAKPPDHSGEEIAEGSPTLAMMDPADMAQPSATGAAPAASVESQDEARCAGSSPELRPEQPLAEPRAGQSPAEVAPQPCAEENGSEPPRPRSEVPALLYPPDATDVVCGLILELSNLNRLAMSAHRGLEALRRPKVRRSRRSGPAHAGRRWKEM